MKKLSVIVLVSLFCITLTSCEKERTCECTVWGFTSSETKTLTKKDAEEWCDGYNQDAATLGGSCALK